ncbi:MAG: hypothetical protein LQ344_007061 [Seirophora lacunosa]|nr:MAG: hypothetical protein LQ344_007061 [Seirophora lacunosa]
MQVRHSHPLPQQTTCEGYVDTKKRTQDRSDRTTAERCRPGIQTRSVLPNPYPMPGTPYSMDFLGPQQPQPPLPAAGVEQVIANWLNELNAVARHHENEPIGRHVIEKSSPWPGYQLLLISYPPPGGLGLTWNNTVTVLDTLLLKMRADGYQQRRGEIVNTATGLIEGSVHFFPQPYWGGRNNEVNNETLRLDAIRNPYTLPNPELTIDFENQGHSLPSSDVNECITLFRRKVIQYVKEHGEGSLPLRLEQDWKGVRFGLFRVTTDRHITLNDTLDVLTVFNFYMEKNGVRAREGNILMQGQSQLKLVAVALLQPSGIKVSNAPGVTQS